MTKKGSLSLSINAIVVLILAIVMLGLALGFIKTMFGKVSTQVEAIVVSEPDPHPASTSEILTLSRDTIILRPGEIAGVKFSAYNAGAVDFKETATGVFSAADIIEVSGCLVASAGPTTPTAPLKLRSQVAKKVPRDTAVTSQLLFQAHNGGVDTLCQICTVSLGDDFGVTPANGVQGCADIRVIVR